MNYFLSHLPRSYAQFDRRSTPVVRAKRPKSPATELATAAQRHCEHAERSDFQQRSWRRMLDKRIDLPAYSIAKDRGVPKDVEENGTRNGYTATGLRQRALDQASMQIQHRRDPST
jgi:hypothetical protein